MAEPSWYDFLIPSEETIEAIQTGIDRGINRCSYFKTRRT